MSHKLKEVIVELDKAKNLIKQQQKEIERLKNMAVNNIVKKYTQKNTHKRNKRNDCPNTTCVDKTN